MTKAEPRASCSRTTDGQPWAFPDGTEGDRVTDEVLLGPGERGLDVTVVDAPGRPKGDRFSISPSSSAATTLPDGSISEMRRSGGSARRRIGGGNSGAGPDRASSRVRGLTPSLGNRPGAATRPSALPGDITLSELRSQLRDIVLEEGYLRLEEPIQLRSGEWSRDFIDGKRALAHGADLELACRALLEMLVDRGIEFDAVGGLTLGADQFAHGTAMVAKKDWFVVRKEPKGRGTNRLVEGALLRAGVRVLLVDDVVTTGGSIKQAWSSIEETGAEIVAAVGGVVLGMFALGLLLFALHALRAPPLVALLAALLVPLSRGVVHVAIHTYYNQLWATFALPFVLLTGWQLARRPSRATAALFALFFTLALFTYPLLLPFPLVFLAVLAWPERARIRALLARRRELPRWARWSAYVVGTIAALYALQGVIEKVAPAANALLPWGDLTGYGGGETLPYLPVGRFFGLEAASLPLQLLILAGLAGLLVYGLRAAERRVAAALAILLAGAALATLYLRLRPDGELFYFKNLSFAATLVLAVVVVGLGRLLLAGRAGAVAAVAALGAMTYGLFDGARREIESTYELGSVNVLEIREWAKEIPTGDTIRIDTEEGAWQLWSWYLLSNHRVSASRPLYGFFPHPPRGFRAEWSLVRKPLVPPDRIGGPEFENREFAIYRIKPNPYPNSSSQTLVWDVKEISYGF